jgi:hypothetical protein
MDRKERAEFIMQKIGACDQIIFIRKEDWWQSVGELSNLLLGDTARYHELGHEVIRTVGKGESLPSLVVWYGTVDGHWEPLCAIMNRLGDSPLGIYYDAI